MYVTVSDFIKEWNKEAQLTQNVLEGLTDESLKQQVYPEGRTLGRIAWHLTASIPDYLAHFGVEVPKKEDEENVPASAKEIADTFKRLSEEAAQAIQQRMDRGHIEPDTERIWQRRNQCTNFNGLN